MGSVRFQKRFTWCQLQLVPYFQEGYRDGVDAGKAVTLQQGFNQGYKEGAEVIINYGLLRGTLR